VALDRGRTTGHHEQQKSETHSDSGHLEVVGGERSEIPELHFDLQVPVPESTWMRGLDFG
jgi:hypothetical protein